MTVLAGTHRLKGVCWSMSESAQYIIHYSGRDIPGLLYASTQFLYTRHLNIIDISMATGGDRHTTFLTCERRTPVGTEPIAESPRVGASSEGDPALGAAPNSFRERQEIKVGLEETLSELYKDYCEKHDEVEDKSPCVDVFLIRSTRAKKPPFVLYLELENDNKEGFNANLSAMLRNVFTLDDAFVRPAVRSAGSRAGGQGTRAPASDSERSRVSMRLSPIYSGAGNSSVGDKTGAKTEPTYDNIAPYNSKENKEAVADIERAVRAFLEAFDEAKRSRPDAGKESASSSLHGSQDLEMLLREVFTTFVLGIDKWIHDPQPAENEAGTETLKQQYNVYVLRAHATYEDPSDSAELEKPRVPRTIDLRDPEPTKPEGENGWEELIDKQTLRLKADTTITVGDILKRYGRGESAWSILKECPLLSPKDLRAAAACAAAHLRSRAAQPAPTEGKNRTAK